MYNKWGFKMISDQRLVQFLEHMELLWGWGSLFIDTFEKSHSVPGDGPRYTELAGRKHSLECLGIHPFLFYFIFSLLYNKGTVLSYSILHTDFRTQSMF